MLLGEKQGSIGCSRHFHRIVVYEVGDGYHGHVQLTTILWRR